MATMTSSTAADPTDSMAEKEASPSTQRDRRPSLLDGARAGAASPQDLLRRLSLVDSDPQQPSSESEKPRVSTSELGLSGNVISATFCVPYKIGLEEDGSWKVSPRRGTSALFDSFSYLASSESEWRHTLVAWTGEIERIQEDDLFVNGAHAGALPGNQLPTFLPYKTRHKLAQASAASELHIPSDKRRRLESQLEHLQGGRVTPVWLPDEISDDETMMLSDQHKWRRYGEHELFTLFHYKMNEPSDGRATKKAWDDYVRMNEAFADRIMDIYSPGDIILIHDYHLFLLPSLLRQRIPNAYIAFFLHIPFPSSEYYRCLTKRKQILQGVLGANMIGFQTHSYSRHFSKCCRLILEYDATPSGIPAFGGHVAIEVCAIGINATTTWQSAFESKEVESTLIALEEKYAGQKVIVGRDRLDSVRGVAQKLQAFEVFLERHPEWHGKVTLIQVTSPTSIEDRDGKNEKTESKITELVTNINSTFGTLKYVPVQYFPQYLSRDEYFALLRMADVGLITSVRDGMNTTALEYIVCQHKNHAPLIISEFSGTAGSLGDAIHINPWDITGVSNAIYKALTMDGEEKTRSHEQLYKHVMENGIQEWTRKYIQRLITNLQMSGRTVNTPPLDHDALVQQYRGSTRRLFMFDYDGTLTPIVRDPDSALPSDRVIRTLKALAADPGNNVWIVSGRPQDFLEEWMGHIPALGLSAEHGCFIRRPHADKWDNLTEQMDLGWHEKVVAIFGRYTAGGTNGTHIERKRIALTWHYRRAEPRWAAGAARDCLRELQEQVEPFYEVDVMKGKMNLEVRPRFVNKGEIARRLVKGFQEKEAPPEFVLCIGDDHTDEGSSRVDPPDVVHVHD